MPKTHPDAPRLVYRIKPPHVWALIQREWERGSTPAELSRKHDVSYSTVTLRRDREGWSRKAPMERLTAPAAVPISATLIAETVLARALEALAQGRPTDATALIKAADAVGAFADFVAKLKAREAAEASPAAD